MKTVELNSAKPRSIRTLEDTQIKKRMVFNVFIVVSKHFNLEIQNNDYLFTGGESVLYVGLFFDADSSL